MTGIVQRRQVGTGSIYRDHDYWVARVQLADGRRVARKRRSHSEAESALLDLRREYAEQLGWHYKDRMTRGWYNDSIRRDRPRSGVTRRVRFQVLERDGFRCVYCGATAKTSTLQMDHVVPVARGGTDHPSNLATACVDCNLGKAAMELSQ